ncbi:hypothetical protein VIGAN_02289700, partial [Vigna angularis var. angularis]
FRIPSSPLPSSLQFQKSLSPLPWSVRHYRKPKLVTLSHCRVANAEVGSLVAITLEGGDSWKLAFALGVVAVSRFDTAV